MARVVVIGAGFAGLACGLTLAKAGHSVQILEADSDVGGLGGGFRFGNVTLEKFYHHWFLSDTHILNMVAELGAHDRIVSRPSRTGLYYNKSVFRLSTPLDLLRFDALPFADRIRLGLFTLYAQSIKDWSGLEDVSAKDWLVRGCGQRAYDVVWRPLLESKFSLYADALSATWFWKKLQLRGGSRGSGGSEMLAYFKGGFAALAELARARIEASGGRVQVATPAIEILAQNGAVFGVRTPAGIVEADYVVATPAFPIIADLLEGACAPEYVRSLRDMKYLSNVCLTLALSKSLSSTYWLNVNDTSFPFVGIIEHTNFEPPEEYDNKHIVYLSRYLHHEDPLYSMGSEELLNYATPHIQKMFPEFSRKWVQEHHLWRARYAQPVTELGYSRRIPATASPVKNLFICTMAQIYPEDRGTNYAVREGEKVADVIVKSELLRSTD